MKFVIFLVLLLASTLAISSGSGAHTFGTESVDEHLLERLQQVEEERYWIGSVLAHVDSFDEVVGYVVENYDSDRNGVIDVAEFHEILTDVYEYHGWGSPSWEDATAQFEHYDWDQSGFLDKKEIEDGVRSYLVDEFDRLSFESAWLKVDLGFLDEHAEMPESQEQGDQWVAGLYDTLEQHYEKLWYMRSLVQDLKFLEENLIYAFTYADRNQNGKLSFREAAPLMREVSDFLGVEQPTDGELKEGFKYLSNMGKADGEMDGEEFAVFAEYALLPTLVFSYAWQTEAVVYFESAIYWLESLGYGDVMAQREQGPYSEGFDVGYEIATHKLYVENLIEEKAQEKNQKQNPPHPHPHPQPKPENEQKQQKQNPPHPHPHPQPKPEGGEQKQNPIKNPRP